MAKHPKQTPVVGNGTTAPVYVQYDVNPEQTKLQVSISTINGSTMTWDQGLIALFDFINGKCDELGYDINMVVEAALAGRRIPVPRGGNNG